MERTWRWFGKKDKITLAQLKQIGVEGTDFLREQVKLNKASDLMFSTAIPE